MTGWPPGFWMQDYVCLDYKPSTGTSILGQVNPGICSHWMGCECDLGYLCRWAGQPPTRETDDE